MKELTQEELKRMNDILREPTPKNVIKKREGSNGVFLNYVSGQYVTNKILEATKNEYTFEIITAEIFRSEPKQKFTWEQNSYGKKVKKPMLDKDGNQLYEQQAPYVIVRGRLSIPGLGIREQFGTSELFGGTTEQAESFKAAATDAFKKCASLFGVALDLYDVLTPMEEPVPDRKISTPPEKKYNNYSTPEPVKTEKIKDADIQKIKELKVKLNITDNDQLNPYMQEFTGNKTATWKNITAANAAAFNVFLGGKVGN